MRKFLVVGSGSAIGSALIARGLAKGDSFISWGRQAPKHSIPFEMAEVADFNQPLPSIEESLDGLVYFPGTITLKPIRSLKIDDFRFDWHVNFLGLVRVVQAVLPHLVEGASLVFLSSVAVALGMPFHASVASAKGAVEGFGRSMAAELAPKIRVNMVAPSLTDTPLAVSLLCQEEKKERAKKRHPLETVGQPEDIAEVIDFLLSPNSKWITGQTFHVDGGLSTLKLFS